MKAKVVIENGLTTIVLVAENEFEKYVIEKVDRNKSRYEIVTDTRWGFIKNNECELHVSLRENNRILPNLKTDN